MIYNWMQLLTGGPPVNNSLLTGGPPVNNSLLTGGLKNLAVLKKLSSDRWPRLVRPPKC